MGVFSWLSLRQLVDFECWKTILARSEKNLRNINSEGAVCVLPNAMESRYLDVSGNIYAFGVLLLEIVSGRPPFCKDRGFLIEWVRKKKKKASNFVTILTKWVLNCAISGCEKSRPFTSGMLHCCRQRSILKHQRQWGVWWIRS